MMDRERVVAEIAREVIARLLPHLDAPAGATRPANGRPAAGPAAAAPPARARKRSPVGDGVFATVDEAVTALREDPTLRIQIEGHTCNIGTAEYNLALGDRRATGVRDYLTSRGITADRLTTVSYGEERPKHDNAREETRRLNRRAALTVNLQR